LTFFGTPPLLPPANAIASPIATATITTMPTPIASARGDACRVRGAPFDRTGGGAAAAARRISLLFLPLAIRGQGSGLVATTCRGEP